MSWEEIRHTGLDAYMDVGGWAYKTLLFYC